MFILQQIIKAAPYLGKNNIEIGGRWNEANDGFFNDDEVIHLKPTFYIAKDPNRIRGKYQEATLKIKKCSGWGDFFGGTTANLSAKETGSLGCIELMVRTIQKEIEVKDAGKQAEEMQKRKLGDIEHAVTSGSTFNIRDKNPLRTKNIDGTITDNSSSSSKKPKTIENMMMNYLLGVEEGKVERLAEEFLTHYMKSNLITEMSFIERAGVIHEESKAAIIEVTLTVILNMHVLHSKRQVRSCGFQA